MGETETVSLKDSGTCQFVRSNGEKCRRALGGGQKHCWQHSRGLRMKWRSLTGNQSVIFSLGVLGVVLAMIPLIKLDPNKRSTAQSEASGNLKPTTSEPTPSVPTAAKPENSKQEDNQNNAAGSDSAIGKLGALGWQVQPGEGTSLQFSDIYKHLPLGQSSKYFCAIDRPFSVNIVGAKSLDGAAGLRCSKHLTKLSLVAAEVNDLSELRYLHNLPAL